MTEIKNKMKLGSEKSDDLYKLTLQERIKSVEMRNNRHDKNSMGQYSSVELSEVYSMQKMKNKMAIIKEKIDYLNIEKINPLKKELEICESKLLSKYTIDYYSFKKDSNRKTRKAIKVELREYNQEKNKLKAKYKKIKTNVDEKALEVLSQRPKNKICKLETELSMYPYRKEILSNKIMEKNDKLNELERKIEALTRTGKEPVQENEKSLSNLSISSLKSMFTFKGKEAIKSEIGKLKDQVKVESTKLGTYLDKLEMLCADENKVRSQLEKEREGKSKTIPKEMPKYLGNPNKNSHNFAR